jgi:hypothetical protein
MTSKIAIVDCHIVSGMRDMIANSVRLRSAAAQ